MKVLIRLDAGHEKGMGHLFRMLVLKRTFERHHIDCCFVIKSNQVAQDLLDNENVTYLNFASGLHENEIVDNTLSRIQDPLVWIFDLLDTKPGWISSVKAHGIPVVSLDDLGAGPREADLVINPIFGCWEKVRNRFKDLCHIKNGPGYAILDPGLSEFSPPPEPENIFSLGISMGGSDTYGATVALAELLARLKIQKVKIHFFLGPHFMHHKELKKIVNGFERPYLIRKAVQDLPRELTRMNMVICSGGQTLFEMLATGMPVLALANEKHEENTIDCFVRKTACLSLGSIHKRIRKDILAEALKTMIHSYSSLSVMGRTAKKILDGQGAARCAELVLSLLHQRNNDDK